jgi:hypothetical protein
MTPVLQISFEILTSLLLDELENDARVIVTVEHNGNTAISQHMSFSNSLAARSETNPTMMEQASLECP